MEISIPLHITVKLAIRIFVSKDIIMKKKIIMVQNQKIIMVQNQNLNALVTKTISKNQAL